MFRIPVAPLFVPGNRPERFIKAAKSGADAIVIDLEDAVAPEQKADARKALLEHSIAGQTVIARVNGVLSPWFAEDASAVARANIDAVMLPKSESPADIAALRAHIGIRIPVIPLIETAAGLSRLASILNAPNVAVAAFGSVDFAHDLGCAHEWEPLLLARLELVWRSRSAGLPPPIDGVTLQIGDEDRLTAEAIRAAACGFGGKLAIHPRQVEPILCRFRPSEEEIAWAERIVASEVTGNATQLDGQMIDKPVVDRARRIVATRYRALGTI